MMDVSNVNTSAVTNIVSGAVINALGLNGSSTGAVTPAREEVGSARGQPNTASDTIGNLTSRLVLHGIVAKYI